MSIYTKLTTLISAAAIALITVVFGLASNAAADCSYQYNAAGFNTSATPVFNNICNVPYVGDEANFVRIRPDVSGNDEDDTNNPAYSIGTISSSCAAGDTFDVWNYIHNNASANDNPDVGDGSAVANGTYINMSAPGLNTTNNQFSFSATVGANNGPSVTNMTPAVLDCNGNDVELTLVPGSVNEVSDYGQTGTIGIWSNLSQNGGALNSNLPIGSTNAGVSSANSGTMWGCWYYRIVIVYQVKVTPVPKVVQPTCNNITANDQADIESISYTANSANVTGYDINLYGGTSTSGTPVASSGNIDLKALPYQFSSKYIQSGKQYTIVATVLTNLGNVTSQGCTYTFVTASAPTTPVSPSTPVTSLTNTGPGTGGLAAIFAGTTAVGSGLYYWLLRRRLANK